jgi:predicted Rossmann fold nucleotide-binding protein DprA/Smf involved in DNA uptake
MTVAINSLSPDSQVLALLCTSLALPPGGLKPLSGSEWSALAATIHRSELKRPGQLLGRSAIEIEDVLGLDRGAGDRLESLLRRGGQLAFELERLSSRGIWLLTRADDYYPQLLKVRLKRAAPAVLFGAGRVENLARRAAAVVGSRNADHDSLEFATRVGRRLASDDIAVVSGAARGVDSTAMLAAVDGGGVALGVVADALEKAIRRQDLRSHVADGLITLLTAYHPEARFTVGNAMRRNRLIYCLADVAFVVASGDKGGTREGALENLKACWVPLFVREREAAPAGTAELLRAGAAPINRNDLECPGLVERMVARAPSQQLLAALEEAPPEAMEPPPGAAAPIADDMVEELRRDSFTLVWPALADYLRLPRTESEVADQLLLQPTQARAWLQRSVEEGRVERVGRPRRYRLAAETPPLFDDDTGT